MPRQLRPREPVAVAPAFVSQLTSLQVLGVDARRFLEAVVPRCKGSVSQVGKLRLVPVETACEALRALAANDAEPVAEPEEDGQPRSVDEVLARLGHERATA